MEEAQASTPGHWARWCLCPGQSKKYLFILSECPHTSHQLHSLKFVLFPSDRHLSKWPGPSHFVSLLQRWRDQELSWLRTMIRKPQRNVSIYKINISIFCDFINIWGVIMTWQEPFNFHFDPFLLLMDHYGITTRPEALSKVAVPEIEGSPDSAANCRLRDFNRFFFTILDIFSNSGS